MPDCHKPLLLNFSTVVATSLNAITTASMLAAKVVLTYLAKMQRSHLVIKMW